MNPPITMTPKSQVTIPFLSNLKQMPHSNLANIAIAFRHDPELKGTVWYDEFLQRVLTGSPPREWTDADDTRVALHLQERRGLLRVTSRQVREVVNSYVMEHQQHVIRDWLSTLTWDGEPRIATAFTDYWNAPSTTTQPPEYVQAVSHNFFIGLIARVMRPGCQLDEMVVFESDQGLGKTSALRVLGGSWYAAAHEAVTHKDFFQDLQGKWVIEISELSAFSKAQVERVKHVISTPVDRYRGSYDRRSTDHPRQCIFAGTTNTDDWGADDTGLRRFWPIRCGWVNRPHLEAARDQLFAEAMHRFSAAEPWWTVPTCAQDVQADRQAADVWVGPIRAWVMGKSQVLIRDILQDALKLPYSQMDKAAQMRASRILKLDGFSKGRARVHGKPEQVWFPPEVGTVTLGGNA